MQSCTDAILTDVSAYKSWWGISINNCLLVLGGWEALLQLQAQVKGGLGIVFPFRHFKVTLVEAYKFLTNGRT